MKSVLKAVCALASLAAALNAGEPEIKPDDFRNQNTGTRKRNDKGC